MPSYLLAGVGAVIRAAAPQSHCLLICFGPLLSHNYKDKKNYEQKCRDKDEAEQAVYRSANVANPKQQEGPPWESQQPEKSKIRICQLTNE